MSNGGSQSDGDSNNTTVSTYGLNFFLSGPVCYVNDWP